MVVLLVSHAASLPDVLNLANVDGSLPCAARSGSPSGCCSVGLVWQQMQASGQVLRLSVHRCCRQGGACACQPARAVSDAAATDPCMAQPACLCGPQDNQTASEAAPVLCRQDGSHSRQPAHPGQGAASRGRAGEARGVTSSLPAAGVHIHQSSIVHTAVTCRLWKI